MDATAAKKQCIDQICIICGNSGDLVENPNEQTYTTIFYYIKESASFKDRNYAQILSTLNTFIAGGDDSRHIGKTRQASILDFSYKKVTFLVFSLQRREFSKKNYEIWPVCREKNDENP